MQNSQKIKQNQTVFAYLRVYIYYFSHTCYLLALISHLYLFTFVFTSLLIKLILKKRTQYYQRETKPH